MIKAVIFDMDGLMVDTEMISCICYREILESYGFSFTKEDYIKDYPGRTLMTSLQFIKDKYHIDDDIHEMADRFHELEDQYVQTHGVDLKPGLVELLQYLKEHNYKIALATSSIRTRATKLLEQHHVLEYLDEMVFGNEIKRGKPFPDIFLKACEKLEVNANQALVLEDSEAGIQAAYDAHIPVICIPDMKYPQEKYINKTTKIYQSLKDVIDYLEVENK